MRYPKMFAGIVIGCTAVAIITGNNIIAGAILGLIIYRLSSKARTKYRKNYIVNKQYEAIKKQEQKEKEKENETEYDFRL